jgi:hypothetical protein
MRTLFFISFFLMLSLSIRAQIVLEALVGNKQAHYDKALNTVSIEGQLTYQFKPWIGLSAGGGFYGELCVPTIGLSLSYMNKKEDFFIQMYPTIGYLERQFAPSVLGLIGYTPKFSKTWGLSSQIIFSIDPIEAAQIVRIGVDYKEKIQFGIGVDMAQNFESKNLQYNLGPFIRYNF